MNTPNPSPQVFLPSRVMERRAALEEKRLEYWVKMKDPEAPWVAIRDLYEQHEAYQEYRFLYYKFFLLSQIMLATEKAYKLSIREGKSVDDYTLTSKSFVPDLKEMFGSKFDEEVCAQASSIIYEKCAEDTSAK